MVLPVCRTRMLSSSRIRQTEKGVLLMSFEAIPDFASEIQPHLRRTDWRDFPDVVIHADESLVKKHPLYAAAKAGNLQATEGLVLETMTLAAIERVGGLLGEAKPFLLPVHAVETAGRNPIPRGLAILLSKMLDLRIDAEVIQINRVGHTGADGFTRLAFPALFNGFVKPGEYFLVDDFIGQGGTLANLKGFIESHGSRVIGATTLTGKSYSAKLKLDNESLQALRSKHGNELEQWWIYTFGYSFERLTESEARYLTRADDAYSVATRIIAARRQRDGGVL